MTRTRLVAKERQVAKQAATLGTTLALVAAFCGGIISVTVGNSKTYLPVPNLLFYRFALATIILGLVGRSSLALGFMNVTFKKD